MKNWIRRFASMVTVGVMTFSLVACGSTAKKEEAIIDESAAVRGQDEGVGEIYIDDQNIALADEYIAANGNLQSAAREALTLTNNERTAAGLPALSWSDGLASAAQVRAQEIVSVFSHTRPNGSDWWTVNSNLMYGENLAKMYQSASGVVQGWMNSPTHRANIMDGSFTTCGIAIYEQNGSWYWAQEFGN